MCMQHTECVLSLNTSLVTPPVYICNRRGEPCRAAQHVSNWVVAASKRVSACRSYVCLEVTELRGLHLAPLVRHEPHGPAEHVHLCVVQGDDRPCLCQVNCGDAEQEKLDQQCLPTTTTTLCHRTHTQGENQAKITTWLLTLLVSCSEQDDASVVPNKALCDLDGALGPSGPGHDHGRLKHLLRHDPGCWVSAMQDTPSCVGGPGTGTQRQELALTVRFTPRLSGRRASTVTAGLSVAIPSPANVVVVGATLHSWSARVWTKPRMLLC